MLTQLCKTYGSITVLLLSADFMSVCLCTRGLGEGLDLRKPRFVVVIEITKANYGRRLPNRAHFKHRFGLNNFLLDIQQLPGSNVDLTVTTTQRQSLDKHLNQYNSQ